MNQEIINILYEDVFELLDIKEWPDEKKNEIVKDLVIILADRMFLKIAEQIPDKDKTELAKMFTDSQVTDEFRMAFLQNHIPNFFEFLKKEIEIFKSDIKMMRAPVSGN